MALQQDAQEDASSSDEAPRGSARASCCGLSLAPDWGTCVFITFLILGAGGGFIYVFAWGALGAPAAALLAASLGSVWSTVLRDPGIIGPDADTNGDTRYRWAEAPAGGLVGGRPLELAGDGEVVLGAPAAAASRPATTAAIVLVEDDDDLPIGMGDEGKKSDKDKVVVVNGVEMFRRYCDTCRQYRPLRASHCSFCNVCVDRYDHHCGMIGACVGRRNLGTFIAFIWVTAVLCLYVLAVVFWYLAGPQDFLDRWDLPTARPAAQVAALALMMFCGAVFVLLAALSASYCRAAGGGYTVREKTRHDILFGKQKRNPFVHASIAANCRDTFCPAQPAGL